MVALTYMRVHDAVGVTDSKVNVYFNNDKIKTKSFSDYIKLYPTTHEKVYEKTNDRWEVVVSVSSNDKFNQVSFVNGISTSKGGYM